MKACQINIKNKITYQLYKTKKVQYSKNFPLKVKSDSRRVFKKGYTYLNNRELKKTKASK